MTRTYTPEAIEALVKAAKLAQMALLPARCADLDNALRGIQPSFDVFCSEILGDGWGFWAMEASIAACRREYLVSYGVEP